VVAEKKKPRLLSAAIGKGRTFEVYVANISPTQQERKNGLNFLRTKSSTIHFYI